MPYKLFEDGDVLTAAEVMTYMMEQQITVFDDATARNAAIVNPVHGMISYIKTPGRFTYYNGTSWRSV